MVSLFLLLGCNLSYIVDLFAVLHELASASARTLLKLASSVRALLKPYGDTLNYIFECDWLMELSDTKLSNNKLSNNKLSDNNLASELVENRTF